MYYTLKPGSHVQLGGPDEKFGQATGVQLPENVFGVVNVMVPCNHNINRGGRIDLND